MGKALSLNEIRTRAAQFALAWRDSPGDEKQDGQSFVRELLDVYGISENRAALYEKRVQRSSTGNQGYIDALIPGTLIIEMKSRGKSLGLAEQQALDYLQHLKEAELPRYVLSCDFARFRLLDTHAPHGSDVTEFALEELPRQAESLGFLAGYQTRSFGNLEQEQASIKAAKIMAGLYEALEGSGYGDHEASVFLVRTLFALYADDAGVWPRDLFTQFLQTRTSVDGADLGPQLTMLFQVMATPADRRSPALDEMLAKFPYVNGGVFAEPLPMPSFTKRMRDQLMVACAFNWSEISPAIFGSLFQAVKSAEARRELGEHYTTETNILKTIEPLFLDELREKFDAAASDVNALKRLRQELALIRVFDPACGCGNFLVVSYRELRALELKILLRLQELGDTSSIPTLYFERTDLAVQLDHIFGIEIEEWPARIAQTALLLAEHQANMAMEAALGKAPTVLPLETVTGIHIGNSLRMDWTAVVPPSDHVMIVGNPPFIGMALMSAEQQDDNRRTFELIQSAGLRTGRLDYVACWYAKALNFMRQSPMTRAAFVSTNSITQGEQARTMVPLLEDNGAEVSFGHQTFKWSSEAPGAAAVHCVVVGFSKKGTSSRSKRLFTYSSIAGEPVEHEVTRLNFYLVDGPNVVPQKLRRPANRAMPFSTQGSKPVDGGFLIIDEAAHPQFDADPIASKYLRRFVQGQDMLQGKPLRWCLWLKDASPVDLRSSQLIQQRLAGVKEARLSSPTASVREYANRPALFTQDRQPSGRYFALPEVSSSNRTWIPGQFYSSDTVAGNKLIIFPEAEDWHAGLLQSSMFMAWVWAFAGRLKSDISISPALAYFPIPWPEIDENLRIQLAEAFEEIVHVRANFAGATLADLYDQSVTPHELLKAHAALDKVVDKAFGATKPLSSNEERQQILFDRYVELTSTD